jgi:aryl-alcohol dehydrogenase-like predicted oxidoreductase
VIYHRTMQTRRFGRLGWQVSEIGYGMWGMGGWSGSDDAQSLASLDQSVAAGVNFFDTAYAYGDGHSEQLLAQTLRAQAHHKLYVATKVPPKNRQWPGTADTPVGDVFPYDYIVEMTEKSLKNLGVERLDLQQLHVWDDAWATDEGWQRAAEDLKAQGKIEGFGISVNRWQPANVVDALETGKVDAVQVVYNVFDQNPEDVLFPAAQRLDVAIIARVPFDEGSLTGKMTRDMTFPKNDWRSLYFTPDNLRDTLDRVDALQKDVPAGMTTAELALRFILEHPVVATTIPGMRKDAHVAENTAVSDGRRLGEGLMADLRKHRWDRTHVIP